MKVFINNSFIPLKRAKISMLDRGFLYGDGVFETMRSYNGKVFKLDKHIDRLLMSLKILKIKIPYSKEKLSGLVDKVIKANRLNSAYVKIIVTRGVSPLGVDISESSKPTVLIFAKPLDSIDKKIYAKGITATTPSINRNEYSFTARIKSLNYLDNILARAEIRSKGFDEAIFLNSKGKVTEASTSNIFMIKKGRVLTPPPAAGLLPGTTREAVIEILKEYFNNRIYEKNIELKDLLSADEIFLTNATLEIVSVVKLGNKIIGKGKPGAFTKLIHALYKMETEALKHE